MKEKSIKEELTDYLKNNGETFGGVLEDFIRVKHGHKASNASRRLRELVNEGKIEVELIKVNGKGPKVTKYKAIYAWPDLYGKDLPNPVPFGLQNIVEQRKLL